MTSKPKNKSGAFGFTQFRRPIKSTVAVPVTKKLTVDSFETIFANHESVQSKAESNLFFATDKHGYRVTNTNDKSNGNRFNKQADDIFDKVTLLGNKHQVTLPKATRKHVTVAAPIPAAKERIAAVDSVNVKKEKPTPKEKLEKTMAILRYRSFFANQ